jgi:hypothetical protein
MYLQKKPPVSVQTSVAGLDALFLAQKTAESKSPAWEVLDKRFAANIAAISVTRAAEMYYTLLFTTGDRDAKNVTVEQNQEQIPLLLLFMATVSSVLGLPNNASTNRQLLYVRAMGEYASQKGVNIPADQRYAFEMARKITWKAYNLNKFGVDRWSPFAADSYKKTAEISAIATAVASGKFKYFEKRMNDMANPYNTWFGKFVDVYGVIPNFNYDLLTKTNTVLRSQFSVGVLSAPTINALVSARKALNLNGDLSLLLAARVGSGVYTARFAALVAAVNKTLGFSAGNKKNIATATSDVLKVLRFIETSAPQSNLGKLVPIWFDWSKSSYKSLNSADTNRIASQLGAKGGPAKVGDAILVLFKAPFTGFAAPKLTTAPIASVVKRVDSALVPKPASTPAPKPGQSSTTAAAKTNIAASSKGVPAAIVAKVAAKQIKTFATKVRTQLVVNTQKLAEQKAAQVAALKTAQDAQVIAQAKVESAPTPTLVEAAKVEAQAAAQAVETATKAVETTTTQIAETEQAIAQVDTAATTAAEAEKVAETAPTPEAVDAAAKAASEAATAATTAAAAVLPPEEVAGAAKEAVVETKVEAATVAAETGDTTLSKAVEAVAESGVVKDAVKEGAEVAADMKKAAGGSTLALVFGGAALAFFLFRKK